ncbi:unnamed protein product [Camellia sinensis]
MWITRDSNERNNTSIVSHQRDSMSYNTESICWDESSHMVLLRKLEAALKDHQVDEAWETHNDFRNLYQKSDLVRSNFLIKLSLSLARAQMPVSASMISRLLLEKESLPPANIFGQVFMHMVKTEVGTYLASNILIELCDQFQHSSANRSTSTKLIKPDTMIFNLVLDACVRFGSSFKGQQIIELMAQAGVIADEHTIDIISLIYQMNVPLLHHYGQFYDSLLSLHFKFNDVGLILDIYRCDEFLHSKKYRKDPQKPCLVPTATEGFYPQMESKEELFIYKNGKVVLSNKGMAKLILQYKGWGRISELSKLSITIQKKVASLKEDSLCSDVIDACINLGWLETAHDILDHMKLAGTPMGTRSYISLLPAYHERKMFGEAEALLKQIKKAGLVEKMSDEAITVSDGESDLAESIIWELEEEVYTVPSVVYEYNSSIYFF